MHFIALFLIVQSSLGQDTEEELTSEEFEIVENDHDVTYSEVGEVPDDLYIDLESMWEDTMSTAGTQEDSSAYEITMTDLEAEIEELWETYEQTEDFEVVEIDGVEYTKDEFLAYIEQKELEMKDLTIEDKELDLNVMLELSEDQGNLFDFEDAMEASEALIEAMDDDDTVLLGTTEYTKENLKTQVEIAKLETSNTLLELEVQDLEAVVLDGSEDGYETYIKEAEDVIAMMQQSEEVDVNGVIYNADSLESSINECEKSLDDMDDLTDLSSEVADLEAQFLIENLTVDDLSDENEEILEVKSLTSDPINILGVEYTANDLETIFGTNQEAIHELELDAKVKEIMEIYDESEDELRMAYEDFTKGIESVMELTDMMNEKDLVELEGQEYTKEELENLIESALEYSESQFIQAAIQEVEENVLTSEANSDEIEIELNALIEILSYMDETDVVTIDGEDYDFTTLTQLVEDFENTLKETLDEEAKENELEDIQEYLELKAYTLDKEDAERLVEELTELENELSDGDTVQIDDQIFTEDDIQDMISDTESLIINLADDQEYVLSENDSVMGLVFLGD
ncbi:hypothetical protein SteCoe_12696 [Stentor coeruleus]|uniref:Uncharacterized protein n=1 Tax=Stentor coeruleus TaxID=5963 RepID=A0A1R2CA96_9CILI|nr:hypothetical protein SteCoe_12696 [Stentor coeruleus]